MISLFKTAGTGLFRTILTESKTAASNIASESRVAKSILSGPASPVPSQPFSSSVISRTIKQDPTASKTGAFFKEFSKQVAINAPPYIILSLLLGSEDEEPQVNQQQQPINKSNS